jgi:hypothetical protein
MLSAASREKELPLPEDYWESYKDEVINRFTSNIGYILGVVLHCLNVLGIRRGDDIGSYLIVSSLIFSMLPAIKFMRNRRAIPAKSIENQYVTH